MTIDPNKKSVVGTDEGDARMSLRRPPETRESWNEWVRRRGFVLSLQHDREERGERSHCDDPECEAHAPEWDKAFLEAGG